MHPEEMGLLPPVWMHPDPSSAFARGTAGWTSSVEGRGKRAGCSTAECPHMKWTAGVWELWNFPRVKLLGLAGVSRLHPKHD